MADETKYTFEYNDAAVSVEKIEAGISRMTGATDKAVQSITSFSDSLGTIRETLQQIQDMDLIPDRSVNNLNRASASVADFQKHLDKSQKGLNQINLTMNQLLHIMEKQNKSLDGQAKKHDEINKKMTGPFKGARRWAKTMGEDPWEGLSQAVGKANGMQSAVTGIDISIGGIIALLVEAYNEGRKIHGLAMQAAGRIGGMPNAIALTTRAMGDLRSNFRMTNEQAGEIVTSLTDMGIHSRKLAGSTILGGSSELSKTNKALGDAQLRLAGIVKEERSIAQQTAGSETFTDVNDSMEFMGVTTTRKRTIDDQLKLTGYSREYKEQVQEVADLTKKESELSQRAVAYSQQEVGIATELAAIQYKYGISVQKSGGFIKQLQMEYGQTEDAARGMLGSVIKGAEELQKSTGAAIGISEVLADYETLIQYNKVYRTDLHSVLGLYNTLVKSSSSHKDNIAGMQGMSKSIALNMAQGLMAAPMKMGIGWKAKFGQGQSAAGRAIEFEDLFSKEGAKKGGLGEAFKRIMGGVSSMTAGTSDAATKEIKTRELLTNLGIFNEETVRDLSKRMGTGLLTQKDFEKISGAMLKEQRASEEGERTWKKDRTKLVSYGGGIATSTKSIAELVKTWAIDNLIGPVNRMVELLEQIAAFFGSTQAAASVAIREQRETLKTIGVSDIAGTSARLSEHAVQFIDPKLVEDRATSAVSSLFQFGERGKVQETMKKLGESGIGINDPRYARELYAQLPPELAKNVNVQTLQAAVATGVTDSINKTFETVSKQIRGLPPEQQAALTAAWREGLESRDEATLNRIIKAMVEIQRGSADLKDLVIKAPAILQIGSLQLLTFGELQSRG